MKWVLDQIDEQIAKLQQAKALIEGAGDQPRRGRPRKSTTALQAVSQPKKRKMSAEGRAAISAASKARWAKARKEKAKKAA